MWWMVHLLWWIFLVLFCETLAYRSDTAGTDDFSMVRDAYVREGQGFICTYAIDNVSSFEEVPNLFEHIQMVKEKAPGKLLLLLSQFDSKKWPLFFVPPNVTWRKIERYLENKEKNWPPNWE